jgi:hypothetical protein
MISKASLIVSVGALFLVTGKVEVMIQDILKEEFLKTECHAVRGRYDAVWCC